MATKAPSKMNQFERGKWWEAFLIAPYYVRVNASQETDEIVAQKANFANAAVAEYRKHVTWRSQT